MIAKVLDFEDSEVLTECRSTLTRAGHDVRDWNHRHLMSVFYTAKALESGERVFVSNAMLPFVESLRKRKQRE